MTVIDMRTRQAIGGQVNPPMPETPASLVVDGEDELNLWRRKAASNLMDYIRVFGLEQTQAILKAQMDYVRCKQIFGGKK
jgi:hypothetical protein